MESHTPRRAPALREPVRYVVVIDQGGSSLARLMIETRQQVAELDGGAPEVVQMTHGITPTKVADEPEWDAALQGHNHRERRAADVYVLTV